MDRIALEHQIEVFSQSEEIRQDRADRDELTVARRHIEAFEEQFENGVRASDTISTVIARRSDGIGISRIDYTRSGDIASLALSGGVSGASALRVYVDRLRSEASFDSVEVPVDMLARTNIDSYSMIIRGEF